MLQKAKEPMLSSLIRGVLSDVYVPGSPCIFDVIEEVEARLQKLPIHHSKGQEELPSIVTNDEYEKPNNDDHIQLEGEQQVGTLDREPPWTLSGVVTEKKSTFVARSAPVTSTEEAKQYLTHLLSTDKKVAKSTHNITAWRIRGKDGVQYQDCDDDGETPAGGRLLHLLELMGPLGCHDSRVSLVWRRSSGS